MDILIKAGQLLLSLSILVIFHEFGHFAFAKLFKTRVEKFYLFFDAWFSLFKFKKGDTEYGIGWIPLGGYVKISGMIDESMDLEQMKQPPQPHEFRSKKSWQRLLIMVGGVLVNFLLAFVIYIGILFTWGDSYLPPQNATYGIVCDSLAIEMGFRNGDKIISIDNEAVRDISSGVMLTLIHDNVNINSIQVDRGGEIIDIVIPEDIIKRIFPEDRDRKRGRKFFSVGYPFIVKEIKDKNAKNAGLEEGDHIYGINDQEIAYFQEFSPVLYENRGKEVVLMVRRDGEEIDIPITLSDNGHIGIYYMTEFDLLEYESVEYGIGESIPVGISRGFKEIGNYLKQLKLIFDFDNGLFKEVGGFVAIGNIFPPVWNWHAFWHLTALLSIMLAVINILPIPALDGGHVLFLLYEVVTGRRPGDKFMEYAQITGIVLLLTLLVLANGNDIYRFFIK